MISSHKLDQHNYFGSGKYKEHAFWTALIRQVLVARLIKKDIETYGTLKVLDAGREYVMSGKTFMMSDDHTYYQSSDQIVGAARGGAVDTQLVTFLKDLRKKVAKQKNVPPYVVFQDPSLDDMATKYPMNMEEMANIHGVGEGKAKKYGKSFVELISSYVDDNDIIRPDDLIIKSTGAKSGNKLYFITSIDRKLSFDDMASAKGMDMNKLIGELESIVYSGTKLNVGYWIDEMLDEEQQEELHEYFIESVSDKIEVAVEEFEGDYEEEEIRLYRLKFISEVAN
jgi:ATP-dependent DNA helicase RecQ